MKYFLKVLIQALIAGGVGLLAIYAFFGFLIPAYMAGIAVAVVYLVLSANRRPKQRQLPEPAEKVANIQSEQDKVIEAAKNDIDLISVYSYYISESEIVQSIDNICKNSKNIIDVLTKYPNKYNMTKTFFTYYIPAIKDMLNKYREFEKNKLDDEESLAFKSKIIEFLKGVDEGFEKLLQNMFKDDILDVTTDINVMRQTLKTQGLIDDDFKK
jgi:5-bromo-4-chloroindolyl phosphate hydrolysis protein